ncbi:DUF11 domain-containing protein [Puniceibacterium sp. IMCC21224]|uniref:DUF11 domain-containing protein n=1 Tax=Puniceibacterium sp. IMCC21224 TaxID=1618204 RepID=UPI00065D2540|nr:DUF11 domain-containing protein [Puniceibacterium sp. IMCC21224]KMK67814.1 conserved repeat protein [Puniceibacterium sp. IMCC21224]
MRSFLRMMGFCAVTAVPLSTIPDMALAAPTPAGTIIRNIAQTTYFNTALGLMETVSSNPVEARVTEVPALEVEGYTDLILSRGTFAQYYFQVSNVGNMPLQINPRITTQGNDELIAEASLVLDLNGNGMVDPGEPVIDETYSASLAAGEYLSFIYSFRVSATAQTGDRFSATLTATAGNEDEAAPLIGAADGRTTIVSAALELEKEQTIQPGDDSTVLRYGLRLRNNSEAPVEGYNAIDGATLRIDGSTVTGVLLRDEIPLNTVFERIEQTGGMEALFHKRGDAAQTYTTRAPSESADVDAIAFFHQGNYPVGRSSDPAFSVRVDHALGAVVVDNMAQTYVGGGDDAFALNSNPVTHDLISGQDATLNFINPETGETTDSGQLESDLNLRIVAGACNLSQNIDTVSVSVRSTITGDVETVLARETGVNTGVFLIAPLPVAVMAQSRTGDGVMASAQGDMLYAQARCGDTILEDDLMIDPGNFLFNAITNLPVDAVTIALLDVSTGREVARVETDARGFFAFGDVDAGNYRYVTVDAPEWSFPSVRLDFPGFGRAVTDAAFGAEFTHIGGMLAVSDIPVDPFYGAPIALSKHADRTRVSQGEFVTYTMDVTNNMHQALVDAQILDRPPFGVALVEGSVSLEGEALADPVRDGDNDLIFNLGILAPLTSYELSYVMHFTAAAREGRNENSALLSGRQAGTGTARQSPLARAMVRLDNSGGVFSRQGTVVGTVFMDCDGNGVQDDIQGDEREPGIPGVRIVTQEGLFVVTDINGKYSLPALRPVTHAFQVQGETLPVGTEVSVTRTNDLRRGGSRIVPLRRGELRTENFAVEACTPEALAEINVRRDRFAENEGPNTLTAADLPIEGQRNPTRSVRSDAGIPTTTQLTGKMLADEVDEAGRAPLAGKTATAAARRPLESIVRSLNSEPGFLDFEDGETVGRRTQNVRVKGKGDLTLGLKVNGRAIGGDRIGEQTSWAAENVQAAEFVAVKLRPGENTLTLVGKDGFGIERMSHQIRLIAPGDPARLEIIAPDTASANPVSVVPVVVRILDSRGLPVPASATVTLRADKALWDVTDIRPGTPGVQVYIDNGEATFGLIPPQVSGPDTITVSGSFDSAETRVTFTPDLNERIMIGVIEGAVSLSGGTGGPLLPADQFSHFEDTTTGLRGEIYLKGAIRGDALLTLRYSSDRDTEDRLFRDIQGDEYYPVYGDNSERGYDAQSSTNLYVKVEKGRSYVLYGDIAIEPESTAFKLGGQRRVATGAQAHWENDRVSVTVFGAYTSQEQKVVEFAGRGVSGPYDLTLDGYVDGSERVEILVRDEEGGDILSETPMRRGTDYLLDYFRNTITFDDPVRQFDIDGNPVSIRVTYEIEEDDADRYWLYGGEVNYSVNDRTTIGARVVHADAEKGNPARERIQSAYLRHETMAGGIWEAEVARSEDANGRSDSAVRLSYDIRTDRERLSFEAIHTGRHFRAGGGLARAGTTQIRLSYGLELSAKSDLEVAAEYVKDRINDTERLTVDALYSRRFTDQFRGEIGVELQRKRSGGDTSDQASLILGGHWTPTDRAGTSVKARLRLPIAGEGDDPAELILGMYREAKPGWRSYNEVELTFGDNMVISRARLGMEYRMTDWLSGTLEISEAPGDQEETLHKGFEAVWEVNGLTTLRLDIEHSRKAKSGRDRLTSIAIGAKWEDNDGTLVGDADFDTTIEEDGNTYYGSLGIAAQVNPDLAVLARTRVALDQRNGEDFRRARTRIGAAYRPLKNPRLDVLAWYEHRLEQKHGRTETHMWSVDASYEANEDLRLNGKYAGQHQTITAGRANTSATTQLLQAGVNYEFGNERFQIGLNAAHLWDDAGNATSGLGAEFGFAVAKGAMLAIGYNAVNGRVTGQSDLYQEGFYFRFNLLLDNSLWDRLDSFLGE